MGHSGRDKNRDNMNHHSAYSSFGSWVRSRRRQLDLTQAELGKRASCSEATIRKIEADERKPSRQLAELLASALFVSPDELQPFLKFARGSSLEIWSFRSVDPLASPNNLPALLTSIIDRVQDHAAITGLLNDNSTRLVTIIGPPGIGKTRLSIFCGNDLLGKFRDGVWFVDLSEVRNPQFFAPTVARVVSGLGLPPSPDIVQLAQGLKNHQILLILDNFEQILEGAAMQVSQLLKTCPRLKTLVTSRLPLSIYGEYEYRLPPLTTPPRILTNDGADLLRYESIQLFVARARLHQTHFSITAENASAVSELCSILDGIPLAIELAAATLRQKKLEEIVALLHDREWTGQVGSPDRDLPERQRTLENVIEWSFNLLSEDTQNFYARLSVLSSWFDAEAASTVCETGSSEAMKYLDLLTQHSLLVRESFAQRTHWRMPELIRDHAYSKLSQSDATEMIRAQYFDEKIKKIRQSSSLASQEAYISHQLPNLHSALIWAINAGRTTLAFDLVIQLESYWFSLGYLREGLDYCRQLFRLSGGLVIEDQMRLLQISSDLAWQQHNFDAAQRYLQQQGEMAKAGGFLSSYAMYRNRLGRILIEQNKFVEAKAALSEALEYAQHDGSPLNPGSPLAQLGEIALFEGRLPQAEIFCHQALTHLDSDDAIFVAMVRTNLAEIALAMDDKGKARYWLREALNPAQSHIRRLIIFLCALSGYLVLSHGGDAELAASIYGAIEKLSERSGLPLGVYYQTVNQQRMKLARQALSADAWQSAYSKGQNWDKIDAIRNAEELLR